MFLLISVTSESLRNALIINMLPGDLNRLFFSVFLFVGVRNGVVGFGTALPAGRARV